MLRFESLGVTMKSAYLHLVSTAAVAVIAALAVPPASAAPSHVKPGLWEVSVASGAMSGMPAMANLPPQARAQMQAHGVQMTGHGIVSKTCISPADAAADRPAVGHSKDCQVENAKFTGNTYSADVICKHETMTTRGHAEFTFESPTHYYGTITTQMAMEGQPMASTTKLDARWQAANCGTVH